MIGTLNHFHLRSMSKRPEMTAAVPPLLASAPFAPGEDAPRETSQGNPGELSRSWIDKVSGRAYVDTSSSSPCQIRQALDPTPPTQRRTASRPLFVSENLPAARIAHATRGAFTTVAGTPVSRFAPDSKPANPPPLTRFNVNPHWDTAR